MTDWECQVCNLSNYDSVDNCSNCGSPKEIICDTCGSKYEYSKFLECFHCPICTAPKIGGVILHTLSKCPTCGDEESKAPLEAVCPDCIKLAQLLINQNGAIGSKKLFEMMKVHNNYEQ